MTVSLCKHGFPVQPPHGSLGRPGDCTSCGITWDQVQDDLRKQEEALILGTSRDGTCPDCGQVHRLFLYQPQEQPWHEIGTEMPVTYLCIGCWNGARDAELLVNTALLDAI